MRSSWRAALRIARRDALRARGRSALIVAMIALPVLALTVGDILYRTYTLDPSEQITRSIGAADAAYRVVSPGEPILQPPAGRRSQPAEPSSGDGTARAPSTRGGDHQQMRPPEAIPAGSRTITDQWAGAYVQAHGALYHANYRELDYTDPIADGMIRQQSGRAPRAKDEVAVTTRLQEALDLTLGDRVEIGLAESSRGASERTTAFTVVGVVVDREVAPAKEVLALPGTLLGGEPQPGMTWLVDTPTPVMWDEVQAANEQGVVVMSRAVVLDPPPPSAVPFDPDGVAGSGNAQAIATSVLIFGMATLEVVLLAGAAFAVGARRQSRQLALVAASGGDARDVRRIVMSSGVVLGAAGAIVGVVLGIGLAAVAIPIARWREIGGLPGHFDLRVLELAGFGLFGGLTGVLAAVIPARSAARQNVITALTGRRGTVAIKRRYPAIGVGLFLCGAAGAGVGTAFRSAVGVTAGAVLTQVGLIVAAPALVGAAARLGRFLPAMPRLALRDAARNRSRAAPAMAAVMAAVAGASAVLLYMHSSSDHWQRTYEPRAEHGQAVLRIPSYIQPERLTAMRQAVRTELPVRDVVALHRPVAATGEGPGPEWLEFMPPPGQRCPLRGADESAVSGQRVQQLREHDPRCQDMYDATGYGLVVGDAGTIRALTGKRSTEAKRTLDRGGVVVFDHDLLADGTAFVQLYYGEREKSRTLPATRLDVAGVTPEVVLSPEAAGELGFRTDVTTLVFQTTRMPTKDEEAAAASALQDITGQTSLYVERGYTNDFRLPILILVLACAIVTLGASGIATGLALADSRADQMTLGAVGGSPWIRRSFAAFQAGTISWLGTGMGIVAGFVPGLAIVWAQQELRVVVPWTSLGGLLVAVPLLAMLAALGFTRSRIGLVRRPQ